VPLLSHRVTRSSGRRLAAVILAAGLGPAGGSVGEPLPSAGRQRGDVGHGLLGGDGLRHFALGKAAANSSRKFFTKTFLVYRWKENVPPAPALQAPVRKDPRDSQTKSRLEAPPRRRSAMESELGAELVSLISFSFRHKRARLAVEPGGRLIPKQPVQGLTEPAMAFEPRLIVVRERVRGGSHQRCHNVVRLRDDSLITPLRHAELSLVEDE
jgi:hypothetical protein